MKACDNGRICENPKAQFFRDLGMLVKGHMDRMPYRDIEEFLTYIGEWAKSTSKFPQFNGIETSNTKDFYEENRILGE